VKAKVPLILVVEDDRSLANWISDYLLENQFEVMLANRGDVAVELVKDDKPDLVILDINLPEKDGFEVCKEITYVSSVSLKLTQCLELCGSMMSE